MATKKPKSSKSNKTKTAKPKTAEMSTEQTEIEAPITNTKTTETSTKEVASKSTSSTTQKSCFSGFFAKKYSEKESILTVFKNHKFYGALVGEIIGTALITLFLFALSISGVAFSNGAANIATYAFALIAIYVAVYAFSGACLNPLVAVGMMASRRMSVIRGIMYIVAEIVGAWIGWLIFNAFHLAGGETAYDMTTMAAIGEGNFWVTAMIELFGAVVIAFFFARALKYKRSVFTFATVVAGGMLLAMLVGFIVSAAFLNLSSNFIFNPAVALMYQIFPTAGESFGEIMGGVCQALSAYAIIPMIGGVCGFYLSDFAAKLSSEE